MKILFSLIGLIFFLAANGQETNIERAEQPLYVYLVVDDVNDFQQIAAANQIPVITTYRPANIVVIPTSKVKLLKKIGMSSKITAISPVSAVPREELQVPGQNIFVNQLHTVHTRHLQWLGDSAVASVKEFAFDSSDVDLRNRVLNRQFLVDERSVHAGIMASLLAGAGNSNWAGKGAAPGCYVRSDGFNMLLPEENYDSLGITVQNHSYGVEIENFYGINAMAYDVSTIQNPSIIQVFSAGNDGLMASNSGKYANVSGFANLTGNFKMAKNVLCVGAVDSFANHTVFSSHGPAYDGRTKPDLVAFGNDGSSGAAALVSGAAAILQTAYKSLHDSLPHSALLRAILINSADDRGPKGPDFFYGFGNMNAGKTVETIAQNHFFEGLAKHGLAQAYQLTVPPNSRSLKVTLAWNDPAAELQASKALINDLDLRVQGPNGQTWLPLVLNTAPHLDSLLRPASPGNDTLNNIEQVVIEIPTAGNYLLEIRGTQVLGHNQPFSVAFQTDTLEHFQWVYPMGQVLAHGGQAALLQWETTSIASTGRLEWKPLEATEWNLLDSMANLQAGFWPWVLPDTFSGAQVRMLLGNKAHISNIFLIHKPVRMEVGFNCSDSVGLFWNKISEHAQYLLYGLEEKNMEPLMIVSDTFLSLRKTDFPQSRFAVAVLTEDGSAIGGKSAAPDIYSQGLNCYQKSFYGTLLDDNTIELKLTLGALYGVEKVQFEKMKGNAFETISAFELPQNEQFAHIDTQPQLGFNTYRAQIFTSNVSAIITDTIVVPFLAGRPGFIFPNPLIKNQTLQVLIPFDENLELKIYDCLGRLLHTQTTDTFPAQLGPIHLPTGMYVVEAQENGARIWTGKLIVQ